MNINRIYTHYRFINGSFRVIGGDGYTKDEVNEMVSGVSDDLRSLFFCPFLYCLYAH